MDLCFECGGQASHKHHVVPKSMGGKKTLWLCADCHGKVHSVDFGIGNLTKLKMKTMKVAGLRISRWSPYGYDLKDDGKTLIKNETEQKAIQRMVCLRNFGFSFLAIARDLESKNIKTKSGNSKWAATTVKRIIQANNGY